MHALALRVHLSHSQMLCMSAKVMNLYSCHYVHVSARDGLVHKHGLMHRQQVNGGRTVSVPHCILQKLTDTLFIYVVEVA